MNNGAKQEDIRQVICDSRPDIICLQETKMMHVDGPTIRNCLGEDFEENFSYLPSQRASEGILIAARESQFKISNPTNTTNTLSVTVTDHTRNVDWLLTGVYGPQGDLEKKMFLRELRRLRQHAPEKWVIMGDFNMIYKEQDKSNDRLDRRLMLRFRRTLNHLEVKEIDMVGRRFTWTNNQQSPTLTRIDRVFYTQPWEDIYLNPFIQPLSSSTSDHCALMIMPMWAPPIKSRFKFETFWVNMEGFHECVEDAWNQPVPTNKNPLTVLHIKLNRVAKALKAWSKKLIPHGRLAMVICREVVAKTRTGARR